MTAKKSGCVPWLFFIGIVLVVAWLLGATTSSPSEPKKVNATTAYAVVWAKNSPTEKRAMCDFWKINPTAALDAIQSGFGAGFDRQSVRVFLNGACK